MSNNISIFVADDHPMLLKGLVVELKEYNYEVVGTAANGASALEQIIALQPTIALLDMEMPMLTGLEVIKKYKEKHTHTKFIMLTSHKEKGFIHQAKQLNIMGYILKDEPFKEVHNCIQSVRMGTPYFSSVFNDVLDNEIAPELQKIKLLSPSERTIVRLVAQGKASKVIGELLSISTRTVEKHRSNIKGKLNLASEQDALFVWAKEFTALLSNL
jgi:two-component system nitrate/nitrite response regulator NarL